MFYFPLCNRGRGYLTPDDVYEVCIVSYYLFFDDFDLGPVALYRLRIWYTKEERSLMEYYLNHLNTCFPALTQKCETFYYRENQLL